MNISYRIHTPGRVACLFFVSVIFAFSPAQAQEAPAPENSEAAAEESTADAAGEETTAQDITEEVTATAPVAATPPAEDTMDEVEPNIAAADVPGASPFLRWIGEEISAPLTELMAQQQQNADQLWAEAAQTRQEVAVMAEEMTALREEISQLRETLDLLVRQVMADLEEENESLRANLAQTQQTQDVEGLVDRLVERHAGTAPAAEMSEAPAVPFAFEILEEWGRSPEQAAELGASASTLKGLIGVVPAGSARADLEQLGRDLHTQYNEYDNLNIEIFDDREAAEGYANNEVANPAHRVLSVTRHASSGRDSIVVFAEGIARDVEF